MQENSQFTLTGPLIWCDNLQVRLWMIFNTIKNDSHHMGMSQICTIAGDYFRPSKPHSGKLWKHETVKLKNQWFRDEKDEDDILAEEFEQEENLVDSGLIDASGNDRKGKFLLYWKTTTLTSTTTTFSSTTTLGTLECTPSGFTLSLCGKK